MRRKTAVLAAVAAIAGVLTIGPAAASAASITLYQDADYRGDRLIVTQAISDLEPLGWTDKASSIRVDDGEWALYRHSDFKGICQNFDAGTDHLSQMMIGNDRVSSLRPGTCGMEILLFDAPYLGADRGCEGWACMVHDHGVNDDGVLTYHDTSRPDVGRLHGGWDNEVSSIVLPYGGIAAFYSEPEFQGRCQTVNAGTFADVFFGGGVVDTLEGSEVGDNAISSFKLGQDCDGGVFAFTGTGGDGILNPILTDQPDLSGGAREYKSLIAGRGTAVQTYSGPNYSGVSTCFSWLGPQLGGFQVIGSVRLGQCGWSGVFLYEGAGFTGVRGLVVPQLEPVDLADSGFAGRAVSIVNGTFASDGTNPPIRVYTGPGGTGTCLHVPSSANVPDLATTVVGTRRLQSLAMGTCPSRATLHFGATSREFANNAPSLPLDLAAQATGVQNDSDRTISVYRGDDYTGICQNIGPGRHIADLTGSVVGVRTIRSIKVTGPCPSSVLLFTGVGYTGDLLTTVRSRRSLPVGFDDAVQSLVNNTPGVVSVYSQAGFRVRCQNVPAGQAIRDLAGSAVGTRTITSVRIGAKCRPRVLLFDRPGLTGDFFGLARDAPDLPATGWGPRTSSLVNNMGTTASVYSQRNYRGRCQNVPDEVPIDSLAGSVMHDNSIRSVRVSAPCPAEVLLFPDAGFVGPARALAGSNAHLASINFAGRTASLANNTGHPVSVYAAPGFIGPCETVAPGTAIPDLRAPERLGVPAIVSVRIPGACGSW